MKVQVCLLVALMPVIFAGVIPENDVLSRCKDKSPEAMGPFLVKLINEMSEDFTDGLPEFGLPSMTELAIESFSMKESSNDDSYFNIDLWDIYAKGLEEAKMTNIEVDYDNKVVHWEATVPELFVRGKYKIDAKLSFIPIQGDGTMWGKLGTSHARGYAKFDLVGEDKHLKVVVKVEDLDANKATVRFNNLFPGNEILKEAAESFINDNTLEMFDLIEPELVKKLSKVATEHMDNIGKTLPIEKLAGEQHLRKAFNV